MDLTDKDFADDRAKWRFLSEAPRADAREPAVQFVASALAAAVGGDEAAFADLAQAYARDVVRYQTDVERVGHESIVPMGQLGEVVRRKVDDCDAKARLFVALCLAEHVPAEMVGWWEPDLAQPFGQRLAHVSARVELGGKWYPVELTLSRARVGDEATNVPKEGNGRWLRPEPR